VPELKGHRILITGAGRGIGAGIARVCAQRGARVALGYSSSADAAEALSRELEGTGHLTVKIDVREPSSVTAAFERVLKEFGGLEGLVNNAGVTADQLLLRMKAEDFDRVLQTNLRGVFLCTKEAVRPMMKAKKGSIVNITSVIGQTGQGGQANYAASKAGIEAFSKSVALEMASRNIRSNCVAPGFIETDMTASLSEAQRTGIMAKIPLGSIGSPEDVANAVCFLLSDESRYVTGQTVSVNGGLYM
jgi:3-oxoacyl-[acyl-carrier protein] reductase